MLQNLAAAAPALNLKNEVLYIGRAEGPEEKLAARLGMRFVPLRVGGLRSLAPLTVARNLMLIARATLRARKELMQFQPNVVLATGGYVSAPAIWAAWSVGVPVIIYLPDLEPGWAVRALWRFSKRVAVSFPEVLGYFPKDKAMVTGYPVRAEFFHATREQGRAHFKLDAAQPVATIFGGSQGAHALNEAARENLAELLTLTQVIHLSGRADEPMLRGHRAGLSDAQNARYRLFGFLDQEMPLALAAADVVVARAGAATLGEFPAVGVPSILAPGTFAHGHQLKNAQFLAARGAAVMLAEDKLTTGLVPTVRDLLNDRARLGRMAEAARALARPEAAQNIANLLRAAAG